MGTEMRRSKKKLILLSKLIQVLDEKYIDLHRKRQKDFRWLRVLSAYRTSKRLKKMKEHREGFVALEMNSLPLWLKL